VYTYFLKISNIITHSSYIIQSSNKMRNLARFALSICRKLTTTAKLSWPKELLNSAETFVFDCDGVIWKGNSLITGADTALTYLRKQHKNIYFVTNNSTKSRGGYLSKFASLNVEAHPHEILSSSYAAALYLKGLGFNKNHRKVYVIGESGICEELACNGIAFIGGPADSDKVASFDHDIVIDREVGAVVVGLDRGINYYKIQYAQRCLNELGAHFVATNRDSVGHFSGEGLWAGGGSMVAAVAGCLEASAPPPTVVGKPSPFLLEHIMRVSGIGDPGRVVMVGDRLDTDILFGKNNGLQTLLTLSGVTTMQQLTSPSNHIHPTYYIDSIADLVPKE
jgi:phosphoglycolate/pyridoxal phosphate phosphatase family enzyme